MKRSPYCLIVLLLALMPALHTATAQENVPQVAPPEDGPVGILAEFEVGELPTPHAEVWFVRMQLEPEGMLPESPQIGPVVIYIEAGQLTLESDLALDVDTVETVRVDESATPAGMHRTVLETGNSAMIAAGTVLAATNASAEPVTFLVVMMYAAELEGTMQETGEPVGLTQSLLSVGSVEFPPIPGTVTIERVEIAPNEQATSMMMAGIEVGIVEEGTALVTFTSYDSTTWIWPGISSAYADRAPVLLSGSAQLDAGDGYSSASSATLWFARDEEPVMVLRVVAGPQMP